MKNAEKKLNKNTFLLIALTALFLLPSVFGATLLQQSIYAVGTGAGINQAPTNVYAGANWTSNITVNVTNPIDVISIGLVRLGTPAGNISLAVYNVNASGFPTGLVANATNVVDASTVSNVGNGGLYNFTFTGFIINATTRYHFVLNANYTQSGVNYVRMSNTVVAGQTGNIAKNDFTGWSVDFSGGSAYQLWNNVTISTATNATFKLNNTYSGSNIQAFCVTNGSLWGCTTNGTAIINGIYTNSTILHTFEFRSNESGGYFNTTYPNTNVSNNVNKSLAQSTVDFTATNKITGQLVTTANFTSFRITNTTHYFDNANNYSINISAPGYINKTITYNTTALQNRTFATASLFKRVFNLSANTYSGYQLKNFTAVITNTQWGYNESFTTTTGNLSFSLDDLYLYNITITTSMSNFPYNVSFVNINVTPNLIFNYSIINLSLRSAITNLSINTFNAQLNSTNFTYSQILNTTNGTIFYYAGPSNWTTFIDALGYAYVSSSFSTQFGMNNITLYAYTSESVNVTFRNEITNAIINVTNITLELISTLHAYNYTTITGFIYFDLIAPNNYTLRYSGTNYTERFGYLEISNRSNQNITLYLLPSNVTTNITLTLINENGQNVENALIRILKYDIATNSYIERETQFTDYAGQIRFGAELSGEFYQFLVEYPLGTVALTTTPSYIISSTLTLQINTRSTDTSIDKYLDVASTLTFNTATNNFRGTFSNSQNILDNVCIYVYRTDINISLYNTSCSTIGVQSGTLLVEVNNISGRTYRADMYYNISGHLYYVRSKNADFSQGQDWGVWGLVIVGILTLILVFMFRESIPLAIVIATLPMVGGSLVGIILIPVWVSLGILVLAIILAMILSRYVQ